MTKNVPRKKAEDFTQSGVVFSVAAADDEYPMREHSYENRCLGEKLLLSGCRTTIFEKIIT
jgi:hypothetical protein